MTQTAANIGSIAISVISRLDTSLSGSTPTVIQDMAHDNANYVNQLTGETGLQDKYVPSLIHLTIADVVSYESSVGVDADFSIGDIRINKGNASSQQQAQIKYHLNKANQLLNNFIRTPMKWNRTYTV